MNQSSWWLNQLLVGFNPFQKLLVKLENLPQISMKIKNIWNHHLATHLKNMLVKMGSSSQNRGEKSKKYVSCHQLPKKDLPFLGWPFFRWSFFAKNLRGFLERFAPSWKEDSSFRKVYSHAAGRRGKSRNDTIWVNARMSLRRWKLSPTKCGENGQKSFTKKVRIVG